MLTAQEREDAFRRDLVLLLARHRAEIEITDDGSTCESRVPIVVVTMSAEWDEDDRRTAEFAEFRL